jgi:predicted nucleic acid-binding protein
MNDYRVQYWDSGVFIEYLTNFNRPRAELIHELILDLERGAIRVVISTFVIAEVRYFTSPGGQDTVRFDRQNRDRITELFTSDKFDYWVLTNRIAQMAADIGNQFRRISPPDCVHLATALAAGVDVFFTYDGAIHQSRRDKLLAYNGRIGDRPLEIRVPFR